MNIYTFPPVRLALVALSTAWIAGCAPAPAENGAGEDVEALSRTEFTERIENFFEYDPLRPGVSAQFLIHLTDLEDGSPVAEARVDLVARSAGGTEVAATRAEIGRVTGIYVAALAIPAPGTYTIDFRIRNDKLDERMVLDGFEVEE